MYADPQSTFSVLPPRLPPGPRVPPLQIGKPTPFEPPRNNLNIYKSRGQRQPAIDNSY